MALSRKDQRSSLQPRRRDVLACGVGLALAPAVSWAGQRGGNALAIGYCRAPATGGEDVAESVVAAGRLATGESRLAGHGVRVTVDGLVGDAERLPALGVRSAELRVGFPAAEVHAWSYRLLPAAQFAAPVSFTVPIDRGLALALEVETLGIQRFETVLVTGREPGAPKLRAGRYLIAPDGGEPGDRRFDPEHSAPRIALSVERLA